jgi:NAD(P)-dependent dehydrogenase (short-subunit alcohol dehydrogenase family)
MRPPPQSFMRAYNGSRTLKGKVAIVTGGDSGIGRAVAIAFAKEGADVVASYLDEQSDMQQTQQAVEAEKRKCLALAGDIGNVSTCRRVVRTAMIHFGRIDVLVNNAAEQHPQKDRVFRY